MSVKKLFVAFPIGEPWKRLLSDHLVLLKACKGFRPTSPSNLHVTLFYLGQVKASVVADLSHGLQFFFRDQKQFSLYFQDTCLMPSLSSPEMLWIRFERSDRFLELHHSVKDVVSGYLLQHSGFSRDPIPHITLSRIANKTSVDHLPAFQSHEVFRISTACLYESHRVGDVLTYTPLECFEMNRGII